MSYCYDLLNQIRRKDFHQSCHFPKTITVTQHTLLKPSILKAKSIIWYHPFSFDFFFLGDSSLLCASCSNSSNVDIVLKLFLSVSADTVFPGRTLMAVVNPASNAALASV